MNKKEEKEFEGLLSIDKTRLDEEAENQPYLVWQYGKESAKAIKALDEAKADLKVVEADVGKLVRENPEDFDLPADKKPSETAIKEAIVQSREHKEANKILIGATYRLNMLEAANKSLDHRRTSLSLLDGQDERGYYARPKQKQRTGVGDDFEHRKKMRDKRKKT